MNLVEQLQARAALWAKMKAFLDNAKKENGILCSDDMTTYENMEAEMGVMDRQIGILNRQADFESKLGAPLSNPITGLPGATGKGKVGRASNEYSDSYWKYCKARMANPDIMNALQIGTDSEGGFLVPESWETDLVRLMSEQSAMRPLAKVITTETDRNIPVVASNGIAYWTAEEAAVTPSDDAFGNIQLTANKMTSTILVSNELLDDSAFNLESYIAEESARRFAVLEEDAYINGDGSGKPKGILNATGGADTGLTTASATAITADEIIDLYFSLKTPYRKNAAWMLNDATVKLIRKLKDTDGNYIWQPSLAAGTPDMILGNKVITSAAMPTLAATKKIIAFGDFFKYWIGDRKQMSLQKVVELYAANGQTGFIATRRVDGKLTIGEAVKVMLMKS